MAVNGRLDEVAAIWFHPGLFSDGLWDGWRRDDNTSGTMSKLLRLWRALRDYADCREFPKCLWRETIAVTQFSKLLTGFFQRHRNSEFTRRRQSIHSVSDRRG